MLIFCLGNRVREFWLSIALLGSYLLIGEEESLAVIWSDSRFHTNLPGIKKLTIIWSDSRIYSNSLGIVANSTEEEEFCQ